MKIIFHRRFVRGANLAGYEKGKDTFMNRIIGVGPREQDFAHTNGFFSGSITLYGSNAGKNISYSGSHRYRINHNIFSGDQERFVDKALLKEIEKDPDVRFMSYDPNQAYECDERIVQRTLCLNDKGLMERLNHKISFREWAGDVCRVHHSDLLLGRDCAYEKLRERYQGYRAFVIQANYATGGEGTYILTAENAGTVESALCGREQYLVSGYEYFNIPVNIHAVVYEKEILLFPVSIQIMQLCGSKLLYQGADYVETARIEKNALEEFRQFMREICAKLQREGFRGITGVDGMIVNGKTYILEMNNRFQGSTPLLNLALRDAGLPSMQELNYEAFQRAESEYDVERLEVPYSCFVYLADGKGEPGAGHKRNWRGDKTVVDVCDDGLDYAWDIAPYATLERVVFRTNLLSVTDEGRVILHPNIPDMSEDWYREITEGRNLLYLKIALINQGVVLTEEARRFLDENGGMREGVYNAVDIYIRNIVINSAVRVKFTALSPFNIRVRSGKLVLYCCEEPIDEIVIQKADKLGEQTTSSGARVKDICILATDRVRVQHSTNCHFKRCEVGCEFCEVENHEFSFGMGDIEEAVDRYIDSEYEFRHFMIGGRSDAPDREADEIVRIAEHIGSRGDWPVYVMCVPPRDRETLKRFFDAHVTELALNLEIWDPEIARRWMPGKGALPRQRYLEMLEYATGLWGKRGAVRSSFIVGLEPEESLLEGIRAVCGVGAAPILSVFRPIPGTRGENLAPPSNEELLSVYLKAQSICGEHGLELGPVCVPCQNNTLSMPHGLLSVGLG